MTICPFPSPSKRLREVLGLIFYYELVVHMSQENSSLVNEVVWWMAFWSKEAKKDQFDIQNDRLKSIISLSA